MTENSEKPSAEGPEVSKEIATVDFSNIFYSASGAASAPVQQNADNFGKPDKHDLKVARYSQAVENEGEYQALEDSNKYNTRFEVLEKASTQSTEESWTLAAIEDDLVEPLYNMEQLTALNEISVVRRACIDAMATSSVGLGYKIVKISPHAEITDSDEIAEQVRCQLEEWASRGEKTFTELCKYLKYDEETTGNGYLEVSRNRKGEIDGLYNVPAHTVRIRRDRTGFVQQRGTKKVPFYRFGDKVQLIKDGTIQYLPNRDPRINEIIQFKLESPRSTYYGIPRDVAAIVTIAGDELARNHNIKFFTHSATPELALVFEWKEGAQPQLIGNQPVRVNLPESIKRGIIEHFRRSLSSQYFEPGLFFLPPGVSLKIERLNPSQRDAGWVKYRQENRNEVRMSHRTPPVMIGDTEGGGYATAAIEKANYQDDVVSPEQQRYEARLMGLLWPEMTMITGNELPITIEEDGTINQVEEISPKNSTGVNPRIWVLQFNEMKISDKAVEAANHQIYGTLGVITKNEIRADIDKRPMKGGDKPPEKPTEGGTPDTTGLQGRPGGGRGANGTVSANLPRRPFEVNAHLPANLNSVGIPMSKSATSEEVTDEIEQRIERVADLEEWETEELVDDIEDLPELDEDLKVQYLQTIEDAFNHFVENVAPSEPDDTEAPSSDS